MRLNELISTSTYPYEEEIMDGYIQFIFDAEGFNFEVLFTPHYDVQENDDGDAWQIEFLRNGCGRSYGQSGDKRIADPFKLFGTIEAIANDFLNTRMPDRLVWFADVKRRNIYRRFKHPKYVQYKNHTKRQNGEPEEGLARR